MKFTFRTKINLALGAGLALLLLISVGSYSTIKGLLDDARTERNSQDTVLLLDRMVSQLKTTESWQRKYLITADTGDLKAYQAARTGVKNTLAEARAAVATTDEQRLWPSLEVSMAHGLESMDQSVKTRQESGLPAAAVQASSDSNRQFRENIDSLVESIKANGSLALQRLHDRTRSSAQVIKLLILAGGLLSLGPLGWAIFMLNHYEAKRRRAEAQLSDSVAMSRAVTEIMGEGVIITTADGLISNVNAAGLKLFGYELPELLGRPVTQLMPVRHRPAFEKYFNARLSQPEGFRESGRETRGLRKNGDEIALQLSFGNVTVDGKRLFTSIVHDITETKRISDALRASESRMRQVIDAVPALIAYVDAEQRIQFHNRAYEESLGLNYDQIHGKTLREVLSSDCYEEVRDKVEEALAGYSVSYERSQMKPQGGLRDYDMKYFPRYGEGEQKDRVIGFFALGNDITELKRIGRMKSEFVSTVSHELRTPLTSIRGSLGLIAGGVAGVLPDKAKSLVGIAKDNCERLIRLINDILDSEKIESGKMRFELQVTELKPLLEQALAANEGFAAQHKVALELDAPDDTLRATVDSDRFMQVVTNLLSNAVKFSPPQTAIQVRLLRADGRVRVEVRDHGSGIPQEFRPRIFQKFSQADSSDTRQKGGPGLGLNISRVIVERMSGRMDFSSEVGAGTTFFFELPEWPTIKSIVASTGPVTAGQPAPRPRILVCADDPDVAQLIGMMLDKGGFDADMVHSAAQALELLTIQAYAAMTVDLRLPDRDGVSLIRALRDEKHTRHLPVVVVSAMAEEGRLQFNNQPLMVSGWLEKPIDENRLILGLRRAIAGITGDKPRILHVEDDQDIQRITAAISQDLATFVFAATLEEARTHLRTHVVDAVLLDLDLGPEEASGSSLFGDIAQLEPAPPVVIFSASDVSDADRGHATAILLKAKTSDDELRATLMRTLTRPRSFHPKT
ncbi:PAS domain S-box protein [Polaromonas jejuensis]|uniref:histidine kinase n=1 Tax=Polaromonas jejuensis TaxID=457502 RepID=A0ABW0QEC8_9BURK|nr:PAS domain S-box protein [Polaromonas jejuensis]